MSWSEVAAALQFWAEAIPKELKIFFVHNHNTVHKFTKNKKKS
jgi:hypothetical protein